MLKLSKNLTAGCAVQRYGDKYVRAGCTSRRVAGVYYPHPEILSVTTICHDGQRRTVSMDVPSGIRIKGVAHVEVRNAT